ncbi:heavy metal translocating P-type ATPase [Cyclobacterium plantarum]|uniref:P-type Zn(2+) transporter n=1 Tax=Cyclobacterium plantarum TaxID=2716263 RepID=A0ABX0HC09_9BACT|nr:heavy metal translocating P-type ATPase [Cyclobacterium plantarum]NHE59187.1 cadmium-translocating P-type ATPase [Cyclobacterium plantarum]
MEASSPAVSCCESPQAKKPKEPGKWSGLWSMWRSSILSLASLLLAILGEYHLPTHVAGISLWLPVYLLSYGLVGYPVLKKGWELIRQGEVFTEFFLMGIATIGAFAIGEYPEAVVVMLFYTIGELLQHQAVSKAKGNIQALLDIRPDQARIVREGERLWVKPENVKIGEILEVQAGERVPLDGTLLHRAGSFNTSAISGESMPAIIQPGEEVLAGMVNLENLLTIQVSRTFQDSSLSKIIRTVQQAMSKKAKTEQFIRKFARIYTPIVTYLALALVVLPYFFVTDYQFRDWLYRALVFLVISCPCALVISIPLGYFGGIGAASRKGILFKGSNYLDLITKVNTVIFDKTGTLTRGVFSVSKMEEMAGADKDWELLAASLEAKSNHPIARALLEYVEGEPYPVSDLKEYAGKGLLGLVQGKQVLVGNQPLMESHNIKGLSQVNGAEETLIFCAVNDVLCGYFVLADQVKEDAAAAFDALKKMGIHELIILSGDKREVVEAVGEALSARQAIGGLLPEDKLVILEKLKQEPGKLIAFVGDGINDAPALAAADLGIAMGGMGSDLAIETADVVIQTDQPSRVALAIRIGKTTRRIVWQNIALAFGVKFLVLSLGAAGLAGMWEAVFADVGVALLAILNAIRINTIYN